MTARLGRFLFGPRHPAIAANRLSASMAIAVLNLMARLDDNRRTDDALAVDQQRVVLELFNREARSLVRLARVFVDNRDAAESLSMLLTLAAQSTSAS